MSTRQLPENWQEIALGDAAKRIVGGGTPSSTNPEFWGGDIAWATPTDITALSGYYIDSTERTITKTGLNSSNANLMPTGSILMTSRATIGYVAINQVPMATNQGFINIETRNGTHNLYLAYALEQMRPELTRLGSGSTFRELNRRDFKKVKILLPPLEQQRKIAAILSSLDDAIEKTQAVIDQLKRVKHGLMQQLFTRGIPGWHRQFKDSKLGTIPQSWEIKQLKHLGKIITGSTPPTKNKEMYGDYIPFVGPANIQNAPKVTILEGNKYISEKGAEVTQITFGPTVLVVCIGSTIGKVAFTRETVAFNQQINSFVPYNGSSLFYFYYLQIRAEAIRRLSGKHAVPIVNRSSFSTLRCAVPSIREQEEISKVLITIDQSIEAEQTEKSQLTVLKKGLMQGLLSGRMGVSG